MNIFTIGFTKKSAEAFFSFIRSENIKTLVDVRLNNVSQLAGYAKRDDLRYFLRELCGVEYEHMPDLAPTKVMLDLYKKKERNWEWYEGEFLDLMSQRSVEKLLSDELLDMGCLLCSEHTPHHCHRRLVVSYLQAQGKQIYVKHLY